MLCFLRGKSAFLFIHMYRINAMYICLQKYISKGLQMTYLTYLNDVLTHAK